MTAKSDKKIFDSSPSAKDSIFFKIRKRTLSLKIRNEEKVFADRVLITKDMEMFDLHIGLFVYFSSRQVSAIFHFSKCSKCRHPQAILRCVFESEMIWFWFVELMEFVNCAQWLVATFVCYTPMKLFTKKLIYVAFICSAEIMDANSMNHTPTISRWLKDN